MQISEKLTPFFDFPFPFPLKPELRFPFPPRWPGERALLVAVAASAANKTRAKALSFPFGTTAETFSRTKLAAR